jgi:uncharacterized RDD family membrane protein YckC
MEEGEPSMVYAGFWKRAAALLIDSIIVGIIVGIGNFILAEWLAGLLGVVAGWLYWAGLESSASQATFGKQVMNIYVTDLYGQRISFMRATGRYFAKILSGIIFLIGYFMAGFTARKQALHDILANTLVLNR